MSDDNDFFDDDATPTIDKWYNFGCLDVCRGRMENVKAAAGGGSAKPRITFTCVSCGREFHADCEGMSHQDKLRVESHNKQAASRCGLSTNRYCTMRPLLLYGQRRVARGGS